MNRIFHLLVFAVLGSALSALAQDVRLTQAPRITMPAPVDSNSPCFWVGDRFFQFNSVGWPMRISECASNNYDLSQTQEVDTTEMRDMAVWMEAVWMDDDGTLFGWYHHEPHGQIPGTTLTSPRIGAAISFDYGRTVHDLGIILESPFPPDASSKNGYFSGGYGDCSVVLDQDRRYFYIFFNNYGGPLETQGVCVARMAFEDRFSPQGRVFKYHQGAWEQPGVGGDVTPYFRTVRNWMEVGPESLWGPSVHWNTHLNRYVMLLNNARGTPTFAQEGVYISFAEDLSVPETWQTPRKILDSSELPEGVSMYPQVVGLNWGESDRLAGRVARLFVSGISVWEIEFGDSVSKPADNGDLPLPIILDPEMFPIE